MGTAEYNRSGGKLVTQQSANSVSMTNMPTVADCFDFGLQG